MFFSSSKKKSREHFVVTHCHCSEQMFCITGTDFESTTFRAGNAALNTAYHQALRSVYFLNLVQTQTQKGKFFKTLLQNNSFLHRAALSGPKPAPTRAR
jgi:hypothetical protein